MSKSTVYGIYDDEEVLLTSVKEIRKNDIDIKEVYTPFPVHGLDKVLGLKDTRMGITAFIYGWIGVTLGASMIYYIMHIDWPMNIGGKPNVTSGSYFYHNLPAYIPILFECTVMCAAHLMSITYFIRCGLYPGSQSKSPDPRTTDDKFLIEIDVESDKKKVIDLLNKTGASEINEKNNSDE